MDQASRTHKAGPVDTAGFPKYLETPGHEEALARLHFLIHHRRRLGLLLGSGGSGKSLLLRTLAAQLRRQAIQVVHVHLLDLDPAAMLWTLAAQLETKPALQEREFTLWRRIVDRLVENRYQRRPTVLLLDDCDRATAETQALVLRLIHADVSPDATISLVMALRPVALGAIDGRLLDLCDLRIELENWTEGDTADFLRGSGAEELPTFDRAAGHRLHQLADGIPRRVRQLAELTRLAAIDQQVSAIDAEMVISVYEALSLHAHAGNR